VRTKAVLDTNVLVSAIFWKGPPSEVLSAWQEGRFVLVVSLPILREYRRVIDELTRKHIPKVSQAVLELIEVHSELVEPVPFSTPVCDDTDDDKFLEAAIAAQANYVVSGDTALLRVKNYEGVAIVKPAHFLRMFLP